MSLGFVDLLRGYKGIPLPHQESSKNNEVFEKGWHHPAPCLEWLNRGQEIGNKTKILVIDDDPELLLHGEDISERKQAEEALL